MRVKTLKLAANYNIIEGMIETRELEGVLLKKNNVKFYTDYNKIFNLFCLFKSYTILCIIKS